MSKKKKAVKTAKATEVTNIFNITIEGAGSGRHALFDEDPFDEDFMDDSFMDHEFLDDSDYDHDCDCDGDCEHCEFFDEEDLTEEDIDDFDEDDVPAIVRFARMNAANSVMYRSFKPDAGEFNYYDENPSNDNLAQEVSRISDISNILAFLVLEADNTVAIYEDCYEDFYDHHSRIDYISVLTGIRRDKVLEVLTVVGVIHKKIQNTIAEAGNTAGEEPFDDEPF